MAVPGTVYAPVLSPFLLYTTYCDRPPEPRKSRKRPRALVLENKRKRPHALVSTCVCKPARAMVNDLMHRGIGGNDRKRLHALACKRLHAFYKSAPSRKSVKRAVQRLDGNAEMSTKKRMLVHAVQSPWIRIPLKGLASAAFFVWSILYTLPCLA